MELSKEYFDEQLKNLATKSDITVINQRIDSLPTHDDLERLMNSEQKHTTETLRTQRWHREERLVILCKSCALRRNGNCG
jgi:hypothetical protein